MIDLLLSSDIQFRVIEKSYARTSHWVQSNNRTGRGYVEAGTMPLCTRRTSWPLYDMFVIKHPSPCIKRNQPPESASPNVETDYRPQMNVIDDVIPVRLCDRLSFRPHNTTLLSPDKYAFSLGLSPVPHGVTPQRPADRGGHVAAEVSPAECEHARCTSHEVFYCGRAVLSAGSANMVRRQHGCPVESTGEG